MKDDNPPQEPLVKRPLITVDEFWLVSIGLFILAVISLFILAAFLFGGDPDISDAIREYVQPGMTADMQLQETEIPAERTDR